VTELSDRLNRGRTFFSHVIETNNSRLRMVEYFLFANKPQKWHELMALREETWINNTWKDM
jgi:hypothetical protein